MTEYRFTEQNDNMLFRMIEDVQKALDAQAYMAALALALVIPDVCGKAEYPNEKSSKARYTKWFDQEISYSEHPDYSNMDPLKEKEAKKLPHLNGEAIYQLRCAILHQGNPNIDNDKIQNDENKIGHFIIEYEKPKVLSIYVDSPQYNNFTGKKSYRVNLNLLCLIICAVAKGYYDGNKEKFNFFEYELIDKDAQLSSFFCIQ
jgi:hypothetical protein